MKIAPAKKRILISSAAFLAGLGAVILILGFPFSDRSSNDNTQTDEIAPKEEDFYGVITYISPSLYPDDKISYALTDDSGGRVILLKAKDEMLIVSEGLKARVYGKVSGTKDGKDKVLLVERVMINNGSN